MRQNTLKWIVVLTLLPILSALAIQYETRRTSGTIYIEKAVPEQVMLILNTTHPEKVETTFMLARDLYNKGIETTLVLEGSGVNLVRMLHTKNFGYEGKIAVCKKCMDKFDIQKEELPDGAYPTSENLTFIIHVEDYMNPSFE
ncbi:hypothetical protein [Halodesulfovibrio aestuarii]|uniref:Uncharacterized protein n=1 Tax=Halodesulfovibrio aestuarii TaxID=126333 RepID=A0A8G2FA64_9BACT|nr:hypothetical protein [Halodesulfovibrio aestuarii]SHJ70738.1 hypothetical protein SAMN05660830_03052 [Halodesulfovibrio aestuarii]